MQAVLDRIEGGRSLLRPLREPSSALRELTRSITYFATIRGQFQTLRDHADGRHVRVTVC